MLSAVVARRTLTPSASTAAAVLLCANADGSAHAAGADQAQPDSHAQGLQVRDLWSGEAGEQPLCLRQPVLNAGPLLSCTACRLH